MSYIKSNDSEDELTILRVQDTPEILIAPLIVDYPPIFKKKKINFEETKHFPNEYKDILDDLELIDSKLVKIAADKIFQWEDVPVVFPPSIIGVDQNGLPLTFSKDSSLFRVSFSDELEEVARDPITGKTKRLNKQQLDSIKKTGSFEVESKIFKGKSHKWVLANWIQKGSLNTKKSFYKEIAIALSLLIITAKRRFSYKRFSFLQGLKSWWTGLKSLLDILIGMPALVTKDYSQQIRKDLKKFSLAELALDESYDQNFALYNSLDEIIDAFLKENSKDWSGPYHFLTPQNIKVDAFLFKTNMKLRKVLENLLIVNEAEKADLERLKIETIDLLKSENKSKNEIKDLVEKILFKEFLNIMYDKIIKSEELNLMHRGLGQLLVEQSKSTLIIKEVCDEYQKEINYHMEKYCGKLKNKKIKFLINTWVEEKMQAEKERFTNLNPYEIHIRSIEKCKEQNLAQSAYFLEREIEFFKQKRDILEREYKKIKNPSKVFKFKRFIWFPKNYKVENVGTLESPSYILEKSIEYTNGTSYLFWRWMNFFMRTGINFFNFIFLFGLVIPFSSPVSFRALFSIKPFYPGKDVNPRTGTLIQSRTKVNSYISRLRALWNHIQVSRNKFESTPDKGLIGKGLQRIFNVFWNYIIKGLFGTLGLSLINPILCLSCSVGSLALCITTPLWVPIFSIIQHLLFVLIWDWDYPYAPSLPRLLRFLRVFIWDFFICGVVQPVSALGTSLVLCPIASSAVFLFSLITTTSRRIWDNFNFYLVLKRNAKVPSCDTFIARRVEGPGIALDYFVQAKPEQILAALEVALEIKIINSYLKNVHDILEQPKNEFKKLFDQLFKKYSLELNSSLEPYKSVSESVSDNFKKYDKEAKKRLGNLNKIIENHQSSKIRLSEKDLKIVVLETAKIIKKHYLDSILKFLNKTPHALFVENNLRDDDWKGLAEIELENLFGKGFLCPLEETDYYFSLSIDHLNLAKYTDMLASSEIRDDLDKVNIKYTPKSEILTIDNQFNYINHFYGSITNKSHHFNNSSEILWSKFKN